MSVSLAVLALAALICLYPEDSVHVLKMQWALLMRWLQCNASLMLEGG